MSANNSNWRKTRPKECRKCGVVEGLTKWFTIWYCPLHLPQKPCLSCLKRPPEVAFSYPTHRRCAACEIAHKRAAQRLYSRDHPRKTKKPAPSKPYRPDPGTQHLRWVRKLPCLIHGESCRGGTAHHVRIGTGGGMALLPSDFWCVPLCHVLHMEGHDKGWLTFQAKYHIDLRAEAIRIAAASPFLVDKPAPVSYSVADQGAIG